MPHERPTNTKCAGCKHLYRGLNYYICGSLRIPIRDNHQQDNCDYENIHQHTD